VRRGRAEADDHQRVPRGEAVLLRDEGGRWGTQPGDQRPHVLGQRGDEVTAEAERLDALRAAPEEEPQMDERPDLVEPVLEGGDHAEVAAPAPEGPEEVGVLVGRRPQDAPVGRDDLRGDQVVRGRAGLAGQPADPAAQGQPGDARVADEATDHGQAVYLGGGIQVAPGRAAAAHRPARGRIDHDPPHAAQVDHQPALADREPGEVVAPAARGELQSPLPTEADGRGDLRGAGAAADERRVAVDGSVPDRARGRSPGRRG
jgi:hypothetical protein